MKRKRSNSVWLEPGIADKETREWRWRQQQRATAKTNSAKPRNRALRFLRFLAIYEVLGNGLFAVLCAVLPPIDGRIPWNFFALVAVLEGLAAAVEGLAQS